MVNRLLPAVRTRDHQIDTGRAERGGNFLSRGIPGIGDRSGKGAEYFGLLSYQPMNARPIDLAVLVYRHVPKADRSRKPLREVCIKRAVGLQNAECLCHRAWSIPAPAGNEMIAQIHADLYCSLNIDRDDILRIVVVDERLCC